MESTAAETRPGPRNRDVSSADAAEPGSPAAEPRNPDLRTPQSHPPVSAFQTTWGEAQLFV